ncbi:hypothetical protein ACJMK2_020178 [Sinanodonta woodiana]|uniref:BET1 homolog n=1 Tax=Sinanodonta woodiana TaxID=1069815 RepID=A0ABD3TZB4_SINWO
MRRSHLGSEQGGYQYTNQLLEEENERLEESLTGKVKALKSMTIDIGHEVREQNKMLGEMDTDFESTGGILQSTMGRLKAITRAGGYKLMWYMILFALFVFFVCWMIIRFR